MSFEYELEISLGNSIGSTASMCRALETWRGASMSSSYSSGFSRVRLLVTLCGGADTYTHAHTHMYKYICVYIYIHIHIWSTSPEQHFHDNCMFFLHCILIFVNKVIQLCRFLIIIQLMRIGVMRCSQIKTPCEINLNSFARTMLHSSDGCSVFHAVY